MRISYFDPSTTPGQLACGEDAIEHKNHLAAVKWLSMAASHGSSREVIIVKEFGTRHAAPSGYIPAENEIQDTTKNAMDAAMLLGKMYLGEHDAVQSYCWYDAAAQIHAAKISRMPPTRGASETNDWEVTHRDDVAKELTASQLTQAKECAANRRLTLAGVR